MSDNAEALSQKLTELAQCEQEMAAADKRAEIFRIQQTQNIYSKRRAITSDIPQFWYIVLAENDDFAEYVRPDDLKYLDFIKDIYVEYAVASDGKEPSHYRDFSISITFHDESGLVPSQIVTKKFYVRDEDGEETLLSEPVSVEWPEELLEISPENIRKEKDGDYTADQKKKYRQGMRSFFAWFAWTGGKPAKEFRAGEDLARLIVDDVFPNAVRYYAEAVNNGNDDDDDSEEEEELDLSDDEPAAKKQKVDE